MPKRALIPWHEFCCRPDGSSPNEQPCSEGVSDYGGQEAASRRPLKPFNASDRIQSEPSEREAEGRCDDKKDMSPSEIDVRQLRWQRTIAVASVAGVIGAAIANYYLYSATNISAEAAKQSADAAQISARAMREQMDMQRETLRARIEFGEIPPPPIWPADIGPQQTRFVTIPWQIEYRNVGRGTATDIWAFVAMNWGTGPEGRGDCWGAHPEGLAEAYAKKETWKRPLTPESVGILVGPVVADINEPRWTRLNLQPVVYYRDEFGTAHETAMTISYTPGDRPGEYATQICRQGTWTR